MPASAPYFLGIGSSVGTVGLLWGLDPSIIKRLRAGRAGRPRPCLGDAFAAIAATRVLDTVPAFELVRERVIPGDAMEAWEHDAKKGTESSKAGAYDTTVEFNDGPTGRCNAGPVDVLGLSALAEAEDANDGDDASAAQPDISPSCSFGEPDYGSALTRNRGQR